MKFLLLALVLSCGKGSNSNSVGQKGEPGKTVTMPNNPPM